MPNPSTVWTTLSMPNPPAGSLPFVDIDNATIITDVLNLYYTSAKVTLPGTDSRLPYQLTVTNGVRLNYQDTSANPGNATINKVAGRAAIAAGTSSIVITNANVFATSIIALHIETTDATLTSAKIVVQGNGTFTITGNANATGTVKVSFIINNVF